MKRFLTVLMFMLLTGACFLTSLVGGLGDNQDDEFKALVATEIALTQQASSQVEENFAAATQTLEWVPSPTSGLSPEQVNQGEHCYWTEVGEQGCDASDVELYPRYRIKTHEFNADLSTVQYGGREYSRIGDQRYLTYQEENGKPLVLIYSVEGFTLEVYQKGDNPEETAPCLVWTFSICQR